MNSYKEKWDLLLSDKRQSDVELTIDPFGCNPFENDYGRLIMSAPVRRLQSKTQIFPLERSTYIRTRLTHSLEVSYIAGLIGQNVERLLLEYGDMPEGKSGWLCSLLRVAGLVHDLGNPPFGHFGEEAIKDFFHSYLRSGGRELNALERADLENFDGNVQAFRILTKLHYFGDKSSYNLTYSTLSSLIKYPCNALVGNQGSSYAEISRKKFGYFASEADRYEVINDYLQLAGRRSPMAYLIEAADDMAYLASDMEDGVKIGAIKLNQIYDIFDEMLTTNHDSVMARFEAINAKFKGDGKLMSALVTQNMGIFLQREMMNAVIDSFKKHYDDIMHGRLEHEIIEVSSAADIHAAFRHILRHLYQNKSKVKKELAGWEVMHGLLTIFMQGCESGDFNSSSNTLASHLYNIISVNIRQNYEQQETYPNNLYNRIRMVIDFLTSLNDRATIDLFQELKGLKL
ncbi:MAG: dNTP triphosphohydrolase [Bacteroidales bacterium]|nr:dNTP triphosphohydrolase [Bacteroidales bacterium]